jgi:hypothetical protein
MSVKVTLQEKPRQFDVMVGECVIGKVTSYLDKVGEEDDAYHAERVVHEEDREFASMGWFNTLLEAAAQVLDYDYCSVKIDKIVERIV